MPLGDEVTMMECGFSPDGGAATTDESAAATGEGEGEGEGSANALFLIVNSSFIAAASFAGAKQGYVFTTGPQGLGYVDLIKAMMCIRGSWFMMTRCAALQVLSDG